MSNMRRREFITLLGGAAVVWPPLEAQAQQSKLRRVGALRRMLHSKAEITARLNGLGGA